MRTLKLKHQTLIASLFPVVLSSIVATMSCYLLKVDPWTGILTGAGFGAMLSVAAALYISYGVAAAMDAPMNSILTTAGSIASTVDQRERLAAQQAAAANETTTAMEELAASARQSAEQAESLAVGARAVVALADEGSSSVQLSLKGMDVLKEKVHTIAGKILLLSEHTSQIGTITHLVTDVASQTNMLALNAAVEAARAGDQGKGFSVVAVEIRKLADQTKKSAERISTLVNDILKAINSTVMATEEGTKTVNEGAQIAQRTVQSFVGVRDAIGKASENTQQISLNARQQSLAVNEVLRAMSDLTISTKEVVESMSQGRARVDVLRAAAKNLQSII